jgi:hypothetical protein
MYLECLVKGVTLCGGIAAQLHLKEVIPYLAAYLVVRLDHPMLNAATTLLDEFSKLPARVERPPTFMEIAGYPHYENVCSNILAFFLDPDEPHGLGILVLNAFASAGDIAAAEEEVGGNVSVEREVITDAGNRIDILIESDTHAVIIENKIFAGAGNHFADYAAYLDRRASDERATHKFLLTAACVIVDPRRNCLV